MNGPIQNEEPAPWGVAAIGSPRRASHDRGYQVCISLSSTFFLPCKAISYDLAPHPLKG